MLKNCFKYLKAFKCSIKKYKMVSLFGNKFYDGKTKINKELLMKEFGKVLKRHYYLFLES